MPLTVNTNVLAHQVLRNLARSSSALGLSLQRLSSGLGINSARDDSAGMAVAERLNSVMKGTDQAIRNANDGISMGQIAETALGQISGNLQRIREIAVQAANGSITDNNRSQLQKEVDQLTQEISRTVQTTEYNGARLLSGTATLTYQIGYSSGPGHQVGLLTTDLAQSLGSPSPGAKAAGAVQSAVQSGGSALAAMMAADQALRQFIPNGLVTNVGPNTYSVTGFASGTPAQDAAWAIYKAAEDAYNGNGGNVAGTYAAMNSATASAASGYGWISSGSGLYAYYQDITATGTVNITNQAFAAAAIGDVDMDIAKVANVRATFGAVQNRFTSVVAGLQSFMENVGASRSRITDTDFANEFAIRTRNQIIQQAGIAALGQANASAAGVLRLLR